MTKRVMDLALAGIVLVLASPILLVAAIAVKLGDGGPVLFRQTAGRPGRQPFSVHKLRTMVVDAEARLDDLLANERRTARCSSSTQDPAVTQVGRFLGARASTSCRSCSNVLRGDMSLVGPRPALPHEVAQFDDELPAGTGCCPAVTGLWQVEGRDNAAFDVVPPTRSLLRRELVGALSTWRSCWPRCRASSCASRGTQPVVGGFGRRFTGTRDDHGEQLLLKSFR